MVDRYEEVNSILRSIDSIQDNFIFLLLDIVESYE